MTHLSISKSVVYLCICLSICSHYDISCRKQPVVLTGQRLCRDLAPRLAQTLVKVYYMCIYIYIYIYTHYYVYIYTYICLFIIIIIIIISSKLAGLLILCLPAAGFPTGASEIGRTAHFA